MQFFKSDLNTKYKKSKSNLISNSIPLSYMLNEKKPLKSTSLIKFNGKKIRAV